jgi:rfaE bifunctional protein kinase chain/domain
VNKQKKNLLNLVDTFSGKKVAVWGDLILDEYIFGTTRRISREAPVLILTYRKSEYSLGGAGNSILNLKALGTEPLPIGVVGADENGKKILNILKQKNISTEYIITDKKLQTPIKTRILAGEESTRKQQILRIDREEKVPESGEIKQKLQKSLSSSLKTSHALLISDYNYGTIKEDIFKRVLPSYKKKNIPVTLDSRFQLLNFKGITVSTPNEPEVEGALHIQIDDDNQVLRKAGRELLNKTKSEAILITRGSKGMVLFEKGKPSSSIPIHGTTDIVDVTGAGDTVISVLTLALTCGATFKEASQLANYAGSVVVMKKGTATLSTKELKLAIIS